MHKVKVDARQDHEKINNFKCLQQGFTKRGVLYVYEFSYIFELYSISKLKFSLLLLLKFFLYT
jgi:hypothetical protein